MWMPRDSVDFATISGELHLVGMIVSRIEKQQDHSTGFFSGPQPDLTMFRVKDERTGQVVSVRFEGPITAMLDQGDRLHVHGYLMQGVLYARRIMSDSGAVLAQSKCFVATAVYGDMWAPEVEVLRRFRERVLHRSRMGRWLAMTYWHIGPRIARWLQTRPLACQLVRATVICPCTVVATAWLAFLPPVRPTFTSETSPPRPEPIIQMTPTWSLVQKED